MANSSGNPDSQVRVLFVTRRFPPSTGGMERFAFDLYSALDRKAEVHILSWGGSNIWLPIILPLFFIHSIYLLLTKKIDIIHMQDGVLSPMGIILGKLFKRPVCVVIHGLDVTYKNGFYQKVVPAALKRANHIFCISEAARMEVVKRGVSKASISVVPLGITDDLFTTNKSLAKQYVLNQLQTNKTAKILLSVGRLVERKGVEWFIKNVMPELRKTYSQDIIFVVVGDGSNRSAIEVAIADSDLQKQVIMLGRASDELLKNLYNAADIFIMPNIPIEGDMEGFGRVLLEASLCELPVVASGIGGIKDAIKNGQNGTLVKAGAKDEYVTVIKKILNDDKYAKSIAQKGRSYTLKVYNWDTIATRYIDEYKILRTKNG